MDVTRVTVTRNSGESKILANATVTFDDVLTIRYKVIKGTDGLFVKEPSRYDGKTDKWYSDVRTVATGSGDQLRNRISEKVLQAYSEAK